MKRNTCLLTLLFVLFSAKAQYGKEFCDIQSKYKTLYWYGHDFSCFNVVEPDFIGKEPELKYKCLIWIERFNKTWPAKKINALLRYNELIDKSFLTATSYQKINVDSFVFKDVKPFDTTKISKVINSVRTKDEGAGLIIVWEMFNKFAESGSGYFVFFDNKTGEILFNLRLEAVYEKSASPSEWGTEAHIWKRVYAVFDKFYKVYKRDMSECKK